MGEPEKEYFALGQGKGRGDLNNYWKILTMSKIKQKIGFYEMITSIPVLISKNLEKRRALERSSFRYRSGGLI